MSRQWFEITRTSWVVDVSSLQSAAGAGKYVAKYLTKSVGHWDELEKLGFSRRYSCNRGWPVDDVWLLGKLYGWVSSGWSEYSPVGASMAKMTEDDELLKPMGDRLNVEELINTKRLGGLSDIRRYVKKMKEWT